MSTRETGGTKVEVCPQCGGVWIEWFDGPVSDVARQLVDDAPRPMGTSEPPRTGLSCPECRSPLAREDRSPSAWLFRCGGCAGSFVPREALGGVSWNPLEERPEDDEETWAERAIEALRDWFDFGD